MWFRVTMRIEQTKKYLGPKEQHHTQLKEENGGIFISDTIF